LIPPLQNPFLQNTYYRDNHLKHAAAAQRRTSTAGDAPAVVVPV